jgi:hypothetical protein
VLYYITFYMFWLTKLPHVAYTQLLLQKHSTSGHISFWFLSVARLLTSVHVTCDNCQMFTNANKKKNQAHTEPNRRPQLCKAHIYSSMTNPLTTGKTTKNAAIANVKTFIRAYIYQWNRKTHSTFQCCHFHSNRWPISNDFPLQHNEWPIYRLSET